MQFSRLAALLILPLALAACGDNGADVAPPAGQAPAPAPAAAAPAAPSPAALPAAAGGQAASGDLDFLWGTWAANLAWCTDQTNGSPITISEDRFEGAENVCDITSLTDSGDGSYAAQMSCQGEGQTISETIAMTPIFAPTGEGLVLQYPDRGTERTTLYRCS